MQIQLAICGSNGLVRTGSDAPPYIAAVGIAFGNGGGGGGGPTDELAAGMADAKGGHKAIGLHSVKPSEQAGVEAAIRPERRRLPISSIENGPSDLPSTANHHLVPDSLFTNCSLRTWTTA